MKQLIFMTVLSAFGTVAALTEPYWGMLLYYTFAMLRPQYLWAWALPVEIRWSLFAALVAIASMVLNFGKTIDRIRVNPIMMLMLVYGLLTALSVVTAYNPVLAQSWGIESGKVILMALLVSQSIKHLWQVRIVSLMVVLTLGYIAWHINSLYLFDGRLDIFHHGYGNLDNNGAALLLGTGTGIAYSFAVSARRLWQRGLAGFLGILMIHAMMMSYSRGAMLAAVVGAVWLVLNHRPRIHAAMIAAVLLVAISVMAGQEIRSRFLSTFRTNMDYSARSRLTSWAAGWDLAWDRPLIGQGVRNSSEFIFRYGADKRGRTIHNQFLQIAADSGFPAAGVYGAMLVTALVFLQRSRRRCEDYLQDCDHRRVPKPTDDQRELIEQIDRIALGCQGSLIMFMTGGVFLSLEAIELPWLIMAMAGVLPMALERHLHGLVHGENKSPEHGPAHQPHTRHTPGLPRRPMPAPNT